MTNRFFFLLTAGIFVSSIAFPARGQLRQDPVDLVDPLIGTGASDTPASRRHSEAGSELKGQTFPAVGVPHGMTSWTPQTTATEQKCLSPYYYRDNRIQGFRASHWMSGSCTQDYGSVTIMPVGARLLTAASARASSFMHAQESAHPDFYRVRLDDTGIIAEITGDSHSGLYRFTYPADGEYYIVIEPNSDEGEAVLQVDPRAREITGFNPVHRIYQGWGKPAGFSGHFIIQVDHPFAAFGTWRGDSTFEGKRSIAGRGQSAGAFIKVRARKGERVQVRIGLSFTSADGARKNLRAEIPHWDFERVRKRSRALWNEALGKVVVEGNEDDKVKFYTALYHTQILPRVHSDVDGTYTGFADDNTVYRAEGFRYYEDFSMWDTYRGVHPLLTILEPEKTVGILKSLVLKAEQGGWLPIFPCWNHYTAAMIGDHVTAAIGDACVKGIDGFDIRKAYTYMRKNAFVPNDDLESYREGKGRRALQSYLRYDYIPMEDSVWDAFHKREQVSRTLEYAYDDFVLSQVAAKLGETEDHRELRRRSMNYRNVFDANTGYVRGRFANGDWVSDFDPFAPRAPFITEGSPFQYTWYVPHDVPGLFKLMGGNAKAAAQLDLMFTGGHYWHGNEPGHQIPYLYMFAGEPWKTQKVVRDLIRDEYGTGPGGLSGNEDAGQMSAWLVFSMMGFYPVTPGTPYYVIGSPALDKVTITTGKAKFVIRVVNNAASNVYIQRITLNGAPLTTGYLGHAQLQQGGELVVEMGSEPSKSWVPRMYTTE